MAGILPALGSEGGADRHGLEGWTQLRLEGRKLLIAKGVVTIARHPATQSGSSSAAAEGIEEALGLADPAALDLLHVGSRLSLLGVKSRHDGFSLFDRAAGQAHAWLEVNPDRKARVAHRFFCPAELHVFSYKPRDDKGGWRLDNEWVKEIALPGEAGDALESEREGGESGGESTSASSAEAEAGLLDGFALLADLRVLFDRERVRILTKDGTTELSVRRAGTERFEMSLDDMDQPGEERRVTLELVDLRLSAADEGETLLNMSGETRLLVDPHSGALVRIEGERDGVPGTLRLEVRGVAFAPDPRPDLPWPEGAGPAEVRARVLPTGGEGALSEENPGDDVRGEEPGGAEAPASSSPPS